MKNTKLDTKKRMFTIFAKGGAPVGYNWPINTGIFNTIKK